MFFTIFNFHLTILACLAFKSNFPTLRTTMNLFLSNYTVYPDQMKLYVIPHPRLVVSLRWIVHNPIYQDYRQFLEFFVSLTIYPHFLHLKQVVLRHASWRVLSNTRWMVAKCLVKSTRVSCFRTSFSDFCLPGSENVFASSIFEIWKTVSHTAKSDKSLLNQNTFLTFSTQCL